MQNEDRQPHIEWHLIVAGEVQGIGFRAAAYQLARELGLVGSAQNLADGTVEVYVQGNRHDLDRFLEKIQMKFNGHIREIRLKELPPDPDKTYFIILH